MFRRHVAGSKALVVAAGPVQLSEHIRTSYSGGLFLSCIRMTGLEG